ncbi:MAG TPA: insulinase family protein, partial [Longimicrobiaceae bacterium]|nr:insulinase family protein [Longimicrobiaceae bacterium]
MLLLALALGAATAAADTAASAPSPPPDQARAGLVAVHRQPAIPFAALRLSVLADDPPGYAGAGHLLQHLLLPSLREQVRRVGGEIQATRSGDAVVYTATGPASELDYLAGVLRSTLRPPRFTESQLVAAARELRDERNAEWETASGHVRALLRAGLFPADLSPAGTAASAERLTADVLPAVWAEMYRPERVAVVAVGDVQVGQVRSAFAQLPAAPGGGLAEWLVDTVSASPPVAPEATRGWIGLGYSASDADPAALIVTARLLRGHLRERLPSVSVETEHWWTRQGQALAVVAAAQPAGLAAARRAVRASVT